MKRIPVGLRNKAKNISLLLLDVDGVLTDGRIIVDDRGIETKHFHVRDGQGIALLLSSGIEVGLITARSSRSVQHRAKELGIHLVRQRVREKIVAYNKIKHSYGLQDNQVAYMGDDIIDLPTLRQAGLALSVADGWYGLRSEVDYVTKAAGGQGAVREVAEMLLTAQGKWATIMDKFAQR